jgi:predicted RecB family nuclease
VVEAQVLHTNAQYRLDGALDVRGLFVERDVTAQIREWLAEMPDLLAMQRRILEGAAAPQIGTGIHCEKPLPCEYWDLCHEDPPEDHIVYLPGLHGKKREELLAQGVTRIGEIPDTFPLSEKQKRAREAVLTGRLMVSDQLKGELDQLEYPLWFIDFETVAPPVPRHAGMGPWQNIPFQWSAHRVDAVGAEPEHYSYLGDTRGDPRREFARTLVETVTGEGQVLVWYRPFEDGRLKELAAEYPEYRGRLVALRARLWDLLELVRRHVYHPAFFGSFSIKAVLPALVPGLSYDGLEVHRGDEASLAWDRMTRGDAGVEEHARVRRALEEYCRLDTLAMVKILEYLRMRVTARGAGI